MIRRFIALVLVTGYFSTAWADSTPEMLGNMKATWHQTCGKNIEIQATEMDGKNSGHTLIGLKNNQTGKLDLFTSVTPTAENKQYDKYVPVVFDSLSKSLIDDTQGRPDIVWGGAMSSMKGIEYSLALGTHVYQCGALDKFAGEIANELYGERENTAG